MPSLPKRGRSVFGHVLGEDIARLEPFHQQSADIADHRSEPVFRLERVGRAYRNSFLAEAGIKSADDFILPEEADHAVFELAIELHVVVEVEILLAGEFGGRGSRFLHRVCDVHTMVSTMLMKAHKTA